MRKQLLILFFALPLLTIGQDELIQAKDSLSLIENIYYERDSYIASDEEREKLTELVSEMQADSTLKIHVVGYSDKWGGEDVNRRFSYVRAKYIGDWIYSCRVPREQITYIGAGIDTLAHTTAKARRVEVLRLMPIMINANNAENTANINNDIVCHSEPDSESHSNVDVVEETQEPSHPAQTPMEDMALSEKVTDIPEHTESEYIEPSHSEPDSESHANVDVVVETQEPPHPAQTPMEDMALSEKVADIPQQTELITHSSPLTTHSSPLTTHNSPLITPNYYIGAGVGISQAWAAFTGAGVNVQILGGVEFTELISTELSLGYSNISMSATPCCENLYLVDGERFFAPVAGIASYRYGDLSSKVNLLQLTAKANFNLVSIWLKDSPWQGLISPKIGYTYSSANVSDITKASSSHFAAGIDLSVGYEITDNWGLRLTTGFEYLTGKGIDALPQHEHGTNTLWNTTINAIYKL